MSDFDQRNCDFSNGMADAQYAYIEAERRVKYLEAENAKLRELVRTMMQFFEDGDWCDKCDHARECDSEEQYEEDCLMRFVFRDRMCELGVEEDA